MHCAILGKSPAHAGVRPKGVFLARIKGTKRRDQALRSRNEIYEAAIALFTEHGFDATTVHDITDRAGVSVGNFYHYFASKNAVLEENFKRADDIFQELIDSGMLKAEGRERISEYMEHYARLILATGFDLSKQLYTYKTKLFLRRGGAMQTGLSKVIAECQADGLLLPSPGPEEICRLLFVAARGVALDWCIHEGDTDIVADMRLVTERMVLGYVPSGVLR